MQEFFAGILEKIAEWLFGVAKTEVNQVIAQKQSDDQIDEQTNNEASALNAATGVEANDQAAHDIINGI